MTFSPWTNAEGELLVDETGAPIWCEECPCPGTRIITCGTNVDYVYPDADSGFYEVVVSGFAGSAAGANGTYVIASGANWGPATGGNGVFAVDVNSRSSSGGLCQRRVRITQPCFGFGVFDFTYQVTDAGPVTIDQTVANAIPLFSGSPGPCHPGVTGPPSVTLRCYL